MQRYNHHCPLLQRYELHRKVGSGAYGFVVAAQDVNTSRVLGAYIDTMSRLG